MNPVVAAVFLFLSLQASVSWGQVSTSQVSEAFRSEGLSRVQEELEVIGRDVLPQDSACPSGGQEVIPRMFTKQSGLLSAIDSIDDILDAVRPELQNRRQQQGRCGKCQQVNLVSSVAAVAPARTVSAPECEGRPTETFRLTFRDPGEIRRYTEDLLKGRSQEGRRLLAGCPNPCAYYVTTAHTKLADDSTHVALTVQCGQPRKGSVFSAVYNFDSGVVHQWSCSR